MDRSAGDSPARLAERDLRSAILPWLTTAIAVYHLGVVAQLPTWLGVFIPDQIHEAIGLCSAFMLLFVFLRPHPRWTDILLLVSGLAVYRRRERSTAL